MRAPFWGSGESKRVRPSAAAAGPGCTRHTKGLSAARWRGERRWGAKALGRASRALERYVPPRPTCSARLRLCSSCPLHLRRRGDWMALAERNDEWCTRRARAGAVRGALEGGEADGVSPRDHSIRQPTCICSRLPVPVALAASRAALGAGRRAAAVRVHALVGCRGERGVGWGGEGRGQEGGRARGLVSGRCQPRSSARPLRGCGWPRVGKARAGAIRGTLEGARQTG